LGSLDITNATRTAGTTPTGIIKFYHIQNVASVSTVGTSSGAKVNLLTDYGFLIKLAAADQLWIHAVGTAALAVSGKITYLAMT